MNKFENAKTITMTVCKDGLAEFYWPRKIHKIDPIVLENIYFNVYSQIETYEDKIKIYNSI